MREMKIDIGGQEFVLAVNWKSFAAIGDNVVDPFILSQRAAAAEMFVEKGLGHLARFEVSGADSIKVLYHGLKDSDIKFDDFADACIACGIGKAYAYAISFLIKLTNPDSEEIEGDKSIKKNVSEGKS